VRIRDGAARPTLDVGRLADTVVTLRKGTGLIVQPSTGGAVTDSFSSRLAVLDACSLTCGTVNFGDEVFSNPWPSKTMRGARVEKAMLRVSAPGAVQRSGLAVRQIGRASSCERVQGAGVRLHVGVSGQCPLEPAPAVGLNAHAETSPERR